MSVRLEEEFLKVSEANVLNLHHSDSYNTIWNKTKQGFKYAYEKYKDEADWFMKTDDDSFLIMENLKKMLIERNANPKDAIWFGHHYRLYIKQGYMAGGAYILSRESTRRFVEKALKFKDPNLCQVNNHRGYEDLEMGRCLNSVGVVPGDSRDEYLRARMYCVNVETAVSPWLPDRKFWFWKYIKHPQYFGHPGCCSDRPISFHYVSYEKLYLYNYLMYNAFVHGENNKFRTPPDPKTLVQNMNINWTYIRQ